MTLAPQAIIAGKVLDEDGEPVPNASVRALRWIYSASGRRQMPAGMSSSAVNGTFMIGSLPAGEYMICASIQSPMFSSASEVSPTPSVERAYVTTYYPSTLDVSQASSVRVTAGGQLDGMDIRLRKSQVFSVRGHIQGGRREQEPPSSLSPTRWC